MSAASITPDEGVRIDDRSLIIDTLFVDDPDVYAGASNAVAAGLDLSCWILTALKAGAIALSVARRSADVADMAAVVSGVHATIDDVRRSIDQAVVVAVSKLETAVAAAVHPTTGQIALASQAAITRLAEGVQALLTGPDAAVPARIRTAVTEAGNQALGEITRALATQAAVTQLAVASDRENLRASVLHAVHTEVAHLGEQNTTLTRMLGEVQTRMDVTAAVQNVPPGSFEIGDRYEVAFHKALTRIAHAAGDGGVDRTGTALGRNGDKIGDHLVQFTSLGEDGPRLVIETKDRAKADKLSISAWREQLQKARSNRAATVSLAVCPTDCVPGGQQLVVLGDNAYILGWDPGADDQVLVAIYLLLRVTAKASLLHPSGTIDFAEVHRLLSALRTDLKPIDAIDSQVGLAEKSLGRIRDTASTLRASLIARITELETAIAA